MDFGLAFTFPFKDPDWLKKIVVISLVGLIPIIGQLVVLGWGFEIARRVIRGEFTPLPELDFGEQLGNGFQVFLIAFVYALPMVIATVPLGILDSYSNNLSQSEGVFIALILCCSALMFLYGLFLGFILPAAYGRFADKGNMGAAFQFGEVFRLVRNNPVAYLIVLLGYLVVSFLAPFGLILCVIGIILTATYSQAVTFHLTGQAYRQAVR